MMTKTIKDQLFQTFSIFSELFSTMHYILYFSDSSCQDEQLIQNNWRESSNNKEKTTKKDSKILAKEASTLSGTSCN